MTPATRAAVVRLPHHCVLTFYHAGGHLCWCEGLAHPGPWRVCEEPMHQDRP